MRLPLDTHLLIWAMGDPGRLSTSLRKRLEDPANALVFSVPSLWELPINARHVLAVAHLPSLHRDPFDRLLLAQATEEGLLLLTADVQLTRYPGPVHFVGNE